MHQGQCFRLQKFTPAGIGPTLYISVKIANITKAGVSGIFSGFPLITCRCVGGVYYQYSCWKRTITSGDGTVVVQIQKGRGPHMYSFPDGSSIVVERSFSKLKLDGFQLKEAWPLPTKRMFVAGNREFIVKPEDDTLLFKYDGELPRLDMVLAAFLVSLYTHNEDNA